MTQIPHDLMTAILDNTADDLPRLIAADWLEEHGESDRAEFIRVQIELARSHRPSMPDGCYCSALGERAPCSWCETVTEEEFREYMDKGYELSDYLEKEKRNEELSKHCIDWFSLPKSNDATSVSWSRGFPHSIRCTMEDFMPGECRECDGKGDYLHPTHYRQPCKLCHGTGKHPGLAAVIGGWPITRLKFTDRGPIYGSDGITAWRWYSTVDDDDNMDESCIGHILYKYLSKELYPPYHSSRELAISALSDAAVRYARGEWERHALTAPRNEILA